MNALNTRWIYTLCFIITYPLLTNIAPAAEKSTEAVKLITNKQQLPSTTRTMQENLANAARRGDLEELRDLFETNELAPVLGKDHINDPITFWKQQSIDGTARDIMASIAEIFTLPPVKLKNGTFIWPYLAKLPLDKLTPAQQIDLFRLAGPKAASQMLKTNRYSHYEAEIGKDGTWHSFKRAEKTPTQP